MFSNINEQHNLMGLECGHKVWEDCIFLIPKKVIPMESEMIEERVLQGLFDSSWGPHWNVHIFCLKWKKKHYSISSAVSINRIILEANGIVPNIAVVSEAVTKVQLSEELYCTLAVTWMRCTRITGTIWPFWSLIAFIGQQDRCMELPFFSHHWLKFLVIYSIPTGDILQDCSLIMTWWKATWVETKEM